MIYVILNRPTRKIHEENENGYKKYIKKYFTNKRIVYKNQNI